MSCAFRALPKLIPNVLLSTPKGGSAIIVSPWVQDLQLQPPILGNEEKWNTQESMLLSGFLLYLIAKRNLNLTMIVRENDSRVQNVTKQILRQFPQNLKVVESMHLHAKVIVTPNFVLQSSANLIPTSLHRNTEACSLFVNQYRSASRYVEFELKLRV